MSAFTAAAAAAAPTWMQPGLYRIDTEAEVTNAHGKAKARQQVDGATGNTTLRTTMEGRPGGSHAHRGDGAVTRCVQAVPTSAVAALIPLTDRACGAQSTTPTRDGFIHVAQCGGMRTTVKGRRIDDDNWTFDHETVPLPGATPPDMTALRAQLQQAAAQGTPQERERAAAVLASLPAMQARMEQARTQAMTGLANGKARARTPADAAAYEQGLEQLRQNWSGDRLTVVRKERWTRIALTCAAGAP